MLTHSSGDNDDRIDEQSTKCHIEHRAPENSGVDNKRTSSRWLQRNDRLHKSGHLEKNVCVPLCVTCGCVCLLSIRNKFDIEWVHLDDVCLSLVPALLPRVCQVCCKFCVILSLKSVWVHQFRLTCALLRCGCGCLDSLCRGVPCGSHAISVVKHLPSDFGKSTKRRRWRPSRVYLNQGSCTLS